MNDRERKDNELGIDLDMKGLTLDSDEAAKPQAQNRPVSHEDMARMIAKNMAMQDGGFDEPITEFQTLARKLSSLKSPKQLKHAVKMQSLHQSRLQRAAQRMEKRRKRSPRQERLSQ